LRFDTNDRARAEDDTIGYIRRQVATHFKENYRSNLLWKKINSRVFSDDPLTKDEVTLNHAKIKQSDIIIAGKKNESCI
jgi:hypothetical protein